MGLKSLRIVLVLLSVSAVKPFGQNVSIDFPEDAAILVPQLVRKYGYLCESHQVITSDRYILTMHRIPNRSGPPVFLQHGLLSSSADWLLAGPGKSLGYILADAGYDVWLGNARGNRYSRNHIMLNPDEEDFWNFSWHEIGIYDVPEMIDYVLYRTKQTSLYYIGHSQGTTVFYIMCSERPKYNAKIKLHMSLAPVAYMDHATIAILKLLDLLLGKQNGKRSQSLHDSSNQILTPSKIKTGKAEVLTPLGPILGQIYCGDKSATQTACVDTMFQTFGTNKKEMNKTLLPVIAGHTPAGASLKQLLHYSQLFFSGKFRQWDAGALENLALYRRLSPPDYPLEKVTAPVYLYYSKNDKLSNEVDVDRLERRLSNVRSKVLLADPEFNHIDYLYAIHAPQLLYQLLLDVINANA